MPIERGWLGDRYVKSGIFIPNALGRFLDGPGGCLVSLVILCGLFMLFAFIVLKMSYGVTAVIMPSETLTEISFYNSSIKNRAEIYADKILEAQAHEMFKGNEFAQQGCTVKVEFSSASSDTLLKHNVNDFDIWYKKPEFSIVQVTRKITSNVYLGDKRVMRADNEYEQISYTYVAYVRMQMYAQRDGLFVEYKFVPEKIQYLE